jgi:hypothetical protein
MKSFDLGAHIIDGHLPESARKYSAWGERRKVRAVSCLARCWMGSRNVDLKAEEVVFRKSSLY